VIGQSQLPELDLPVETVDATALEPTEAVVDE